MRLLIKIILFFSLFCINTLANATTYTLYPVRDGKLNPSSQTTPDFNSTTCGNSTAWDQSACIFYFDLTGINAADVVDADMRIVQSNNRGGQHTQTYYRLLKDWTTQATWINYSTGNPWTTPGALGLDTDYTTTNSASVVIQNDVGSILTTKVTNLVKDMITNGNYGIALRRISGGVYVSFRMSEYPGTSSDPQLSIRTGTPGTPTTWYARLDGGTCGVGNQCDGVTDASYASTPGYAGGTGINQPCACSKPSYAAVNMAGEDILEVGDGEFNDSGIGIPAGTNTSLLTKIRGKHYANCTNPAASTIWADSGTLLTVGSYTDVQCLTLTDHKEGTYAAVIYDSPPSSTTNGIVVRDDSTDIYFTNVDSYGHYRGLYGTRLGNVTGVNFRLVGNWSVGWDSDGPTTNDGYTGTVKLYNSAISWNGCATHYPLVNPTNLLAKENFWYCCTQSQQCYGDGIGLGDGEGGNWEFYGGEVSHNTSDGLDTLHGGGVGKHLIVDKVRAEGNTGNQLKYTAQNAIIRDSVIVGNCAYHEHQTGLTATPLQADPRMGFQDGYPHIGVTTLVGTGFPISGELLGTGNGTTFIFSGKTTKFPLQKDAPYTTVTYTRGGVVKTATSGAKYYFGTSQNGNYTSSDVLSYSDLVVSASQNNLVTSASHIFTSADVGNTLTITASAGWTAGTYRINSISGSGAVLYNSANSVAASPAAVNTTGGIWSEPVINNKNSDFNTSYINYTTGNWRLNFVVPPDNGTSITINYVYNDLSSALINMTSLTVDSVDNKKVTSTQHYFTADDVGHSIFLPANQTPSNGFILNASYLISSVSNGAAILTTSPGAVNSSGIGWSMAPPYTGDRTVFYPAIYEVVIDGNGTPDTFKWRATENNITGAYTTGIPITGNSQLLSNGVTIKFKETTGHVIGDTYTFKNVGYYFGTCRAYGSTIASATPAGFRTDLVGNTIVGMGDVSFDKGGNACTAGTEKIYSRNNIWLLGMDYDGHGYSDPNAQFYTGYSACNAIGVFDSDYDAVCGGKGVVTSCTAPGKHNTCSSSCSGNPFGFNTAPDLGYPTRYQGDAMPLTLGPTSNLLYSVGGVNTADETAVNADAYDFNYSPRGANWDKGAIQGTSPGVSCSDSIQNGLETGIDCGGVCLNSCPLLPNGSACISNSECTSNNCVGNVCTAPACTANGGSCSLGTTCCSTFCSSGQCVTNICGDAIITSPEVCDGGNLNSQTCATLGFASGSLSCAVNCLAFNTSSCVSSGGGGSTTVKSQLQGSVLLNGNVSF